MPDKSVAEKLLIKDNYKVLLVNEPKDYRATLGKLPAGAKVSTEASGSFDLIQVFVSSKKELETSLKKVKGSLKLGGLLWVTYPKGTSKVKVDINRDIIREYAESDGFKAVAMIAVDDTWSALRLKVV